ncbi:oligosaccharide flippase family protein [Parvibaculaceae bacterium PLY_AMNH_Bact1]|nr:oligosaccharide flippase family protein [Parvibaculaceae bacterium PLY_AMNH_Bact1]
MKRLPAVSGFLKTSSLLMLARIGGTGLGFVIQLALVRLMTPTDYGIYVVALSLASVLSIFCAFGLPSVTARFVAGYQEAGDGARVAGFIQSTKRHIAAISLIFGLLAFGVLWSGFISTDYQMPLMLACLIAPVLAAMRFGGALSNTARRFYLTYLPDVTFRPLLLVGSLLCIYVLAIPMTTANVLLVHLLTALAACCLLWVVLQPRRQFGLHGVQPASENRTWRQAATPMILVTLLTSFLADIDVLLLSAFLPADQVGIFSVCLRIMLLIEFGIQTVFQMSMPDFAEARARNDTTLMNAAMRHAQHMTFCFTLVALSGVAVFGEWLLLLFGERFTVGADALLFLVVGQVVRSLFGPVTQVLTVAGAQMRSLVSYGIALFALILGNALFVPLIGLEGAAAVLSFSMVLGALFQAQAASQKIGLSVVSTFFSMSAAEEGLADSR